MLSFEKIEMKMSRNYVLLYIYFVAFAYLASLSHNKFAKQQIKI